MTSSPNNLLEKIRCPNCWHEFPPDQLHFYSTSPEFAFDHVLGAGQQRAFLPSRFTPKGDAIDPGGGICTETACPRCHLRVPRLLAQFPTIAVSIFGSPGSGKSFLIAAMTHTVMQQIVHYGVTAEDADPLLNAIVRDYEKTLFQQASPDVTVQLRKTEDVGDWYNKIQQRGRTKTLPKPFLYRIERFWGNDTGKHDGRCLCLYDNAGESFEPGAENEDNPVTRHMAKADTLLFVYDPTQETAFRRACAEKSPDPQWRGQARGDQTALFTEATKRIRDFRSMRPTDEIDTPLIVLLPKFDAWKFLLTDKDLPNPYKEVTLKAGGSSIRFLDTDVLLDVSRKCRLLIKKYQPALLAKIEATFNSKRIIFLPVSATGCSPIKNVPSEPEKDVIPSLDSLDLEGMDLLSEEPASNPDGYGHFRAGDINPIWAEMPLLTVLKFVAPKFLPRAKQ